MIRQQLIDAAVPKSEEILHLIAKAENHKKIVWTAGRVLKTAALWNRVERLDYEERKVVLNRITNILEEFAFRGLLQPRSEPQSIGYGNESGFDYISPTQAL